MDATYQLCVKLCCVMAEELARKRRQRAGYRSSAKRIISSVIDVLGGGDISQVGEHEIKLKQQRAAYSRNSIPFDNFLQKFLPLWPKKKSKVKLSEQLAIANIENALSPKVVCSNVKNEANVSEST